MSAICYAQPSLHLEEKIYDINYLTSLRFSCSVPDSIGAINNISLHTVIYLKSEKGAAFLVGIETAKWEDETVQPGETREFIIEFKEPFYDPEKKLQVEYSWFWCP